MEIKKGQVYECLISYAHWKKGFVYDSILDGYLKDEVGDNVRISDIGFIQNHFKLVNDNTPSYYDNSKGSIYLFADNQKLNGWETDIIKRIVRCRKKGQWKEDLEKTKHLIDLYIKEYEKI